MKRLADFCPDLFKQPAMIPRDSYNFRELLPVRSLVWWRSHMWSALKARVGGFNDMLCLTLGEMVKRSTWRRSFQVGWELYPPTTKGYQQRKFLGKQPVFRMWPTHAIGKCLRSWELDRTWQARLKIEVGRWKNEIEPQTRGFKSNECGSNCFFLGGGFGSGIHPPRFRCLVFGPVSIALLNWWEAHWIDGFQVGDFFGRSFWVARILPQNTCRTLDKFSFCFWGK